MNSKTVSILLSIALLAGLNIAARAAIAVGEPDDPDEVVADDVDNEALATSQDQSAANSAAATSGNLGTIYVGPSASGESVRILSTAYTLPPLRSACLTCFGVGIIIGPGDLSTPWIVDRLRVAYEAGHAVGLTNATVASIERLRDLLGHRGSAEPAGSGMQVDLVAFRKAHRPAGQLNFSSHTLLPRTAVTPASFRQLKNKKLKRKLRKRLRRLADRNDIKALRRIFSVTPFLPSQPPGDTPQNLLLLADSYISHAIASGFQGSSVQIVNTVWDARSFLNSADLYYALQEIDISGPISAGATAITANNSLLLPNAAPTTIQPSPESTGRTTTITSGVSASFGGNIGYNEMQGVNATASAGLTISNSNTVVVPSVSVNNNGNLRTGETVWEYFVLGFNGRTQLTFYNQWIWQVPFTAYSTAQQNITFMSQAELGILTNSLTANLNSLVPLPFGDVFALQLPAVTSLSSSTVQEGTVFTIQGTGFYPSLVTAVIIGGTAVNPANITTVSDTQINVVAPFLCVDCAVAVQTTQGTSNDNFTITIF